MLSVPQPPHGLAQLFWLGKSQVKFGLVLTIQQLNKVTKDVAYPIPRTQGCLNAMAGATMFSTMDITLAYNQVPVAEKDIPKTAFVIKYGLYEFTKMPFGLSTAPQTYEHLMEFTLYGLHWSLCLIYLDDVIVFSHDFDEHKDRLDKVLT